MVDAKIISIFRLTAAVDTPTTEKIDFNIVANKDTTVENAFIEQLTKKELEGIGNNLAAEKADGNVQPLGPIEAIWDIDGFISNMHGNGDDGQNAFVQTLTAWKSESPVNDNWPGGRFGIIDNNDVTNTLLPVREPVADVVGLIFQDFQKTNDYSRNQVKFKLIFRRSRGLDV